MEQARRLEPVWICLLGLACLAAVGAMPVSGADLWQIVSIGGGTAVLAAWLAALMTGQIFTKSAMEAMEKRVERLETDLKGVERERDTYREWAMGSLNSQKTVAETVAKLIGQQQP